MDLKELSMLPSPFYRVSVKAFIFDNQQRLLMGKTKESVWEPPGGGLEHDESLEGCLQREMQEELGVSLASIGKPIVFYRGTNVRGFQALKIALEATLVNQDFKFGDLIEAKFVTEEELLKLNMSPDESGIKDQINKIWPTGK
ncbi:MAG TPA: NUDIX hydrolase [Candidatus Babeliales bacterium]|nr:NUDIX hydrolase [Candidatus Babeliales bacterium]